MTNIYIAPTNGHEIIRTTDGGLRINMPGMDYVAGHEPQTLVAGRVESLREYFRDERDKELGRWRSKKDHDYYVIPYYSNLDTVTVVYERDNRHQVAHRSEDYSVLRGFKEVGEEYFAAHPEKKSWHDAEDGHLYLLNFKDAPNVDVSALVKGGTFVYNDPCCDGWDALDSDRIKSARRIWPENKES